jgi:hypothetical protein
MAIFDFVHHSRPLRATSLPRGFNALGASLIKCEAEKEFVLEAVTVKREANRNWP